MKKLKVIPVEIVYSWETGTHYLRIVGRPLTKEEFHRLRWRGLIYGAFGMDAAEMEIPEGWYLSEEYEELEKLGFTVEKEIKEFIDRKREYRRKSRLVREVAGKAGIKCPKCGRRLEVGEWTDRGAVLLCYRDEYSAVIKVDVVENKYEVVDEGFDEDKNREYGVRLFWYKPLLETLDVEEAKAEIMKESGVVGACLICGETLETIAEVVEHLRKVHGRD